NPVASRMARDADLIVALGTRLGFNTTFYTYDNLSRSAQIVQVDVEPEALGRYFPIELGVLSDAGSFASVLAAKAGTVTKHGNWPAWCQAAVEERTTLWRKRDADGESEQVPLT